MEPEYRKLIERRSVRIPNGCMVWTGMLDKDGYPRLSWPKGGKHYSAHRLAYISKFGPIPSGLEIDHICRNRACVNPDHLSAISHTENVKRRNMANVGAHEREKTHCPKGHPLSGENLLVSMSGGKRRRKCRACNRAQCKAAYHAKKATS